MNIFKSRKFRQGSAATAITVVVIALIVVLNMVVTLLSERFSLRLDLTGEKFFTLSEESLEFLSHVEKDVDVYVLDDEVRFMERGSYYKQAIEVVQRYASASPHISVTFVDIVKDPTFPTLYPDIIMNTGNILVDCGGRAVVLTAYDLFNTQMDETGRTGIVSSKAEQAFSSAILNVTSDKRFTVAILTGHNETNAEDLAALLRTNNYDIIEQNLMTDPEIDPNAIIAIMCAPTRDLSEAEAAKLDAFLDNGGQLGKTLFYMASSTQANPMPVMDGLLQDWGLSVGTGIVYETSQGRLFDYNIYSTLAEYSELEYSKTVIAKNLPMAMANARPISYAFESSGLFATTPLLHFSATSGLRPATAPSGWVPSAGATSGPMDAMGMSQMIRYDGVVPFSSTILLAGTELLVDPAVLGSPNLANSTYLLSVLAALAGRDEVVQIQNKSLGYTELAITPEQTLAISGVLTIVFPLIILICGIVIWMMRRHK